MARRTKALTVSEAEAAISRKPKEVEHSPSGMKQIGAAVHVSGLEKPLHFPLGCQWRWFLAIPNKPLLQVVSGEKVVAEIDGNAVIAVYGPAWTNPVQRTPERP